MYSAAEIPDSPRDDLIPRGNYLPKELAPKLPPDPDAPARRADLLSLLMGAQKKAV